MYRNIFCLISSNTASGNIHFSISKAPKLQVRNRLPVSFQSKKWYGTIQIYFAPIPHIYIPVWDFDRAVIYLFVAIKIVSSKFQMSIAAAEKSRVMIQAPIKIPFIQNWLQTIWQDCSLKIKKNVMLGTIFLGLTFKFISMYSYFSPTTFRQTSRVVWILCQKYMLRQHTIFLFLFQLFTLVNKITARLHCQFITNRYYTYLLPIIRFETFTVMR